MNGQDCRFDGGGSGDHILDLDIVAKDGGVLGEKLVLGEDE